MLTPQAIKDQEFQVKFRGYNTIEVKSYLELLAEDFFELYEQSHVHTEEIESLIAEQELLQIEKERLEKELRVGQVSREEIEEEVQEEYREKDREIGGLKNQVGELETTVSEFEDERVTYREKIAELEEKLSSGSDARVKEQNETEMLQEKFHRLEERNRELEKEGLDFKTTILAAQKFADNLRETSEQDAQTIIEQAKTEVGKIRNEARAELAHLPGKIEELQQRKNQVRNELKAILEKYMDGLDTPGGADGEMQENDLSDLFQRIKIPDGENVDLDDITDSTAELK